MAGLSLAIGWLRALHALNASTLETDADVRTFVQVAVPVPPSHETHLRLNPPVEAVGAGRIELPTPTVSM